MSVQNRKRFNVISYVTRSLLERKLRTMLTVGGISVCVALFILFNAFGEGLDEYISGRASSTQIEEYKEMAELLDGWLYILTSILVIILAVTVANTMLISVSERRRELGTLKALGLTRGQIREIILIEAMAVTGLAFIIGTCLGISLALVCDYMFWQAAGTSGGGIGFFFAPAQITIGTILFAAFISIVIGTFAALYPAVRAGSQEPAEALRYE